MQTLRKIVSKISNESIFSKIIQQKSPRQQQFSQAVQQFSHMNQQQKQSTLQTIFNTFKRQRSTRAIISALLLIDYLHSLQPEITLFHNCHQPQISKQKSIGKKHISLNQKVFVAEEQFVKFYFNYLKQTGKKVGKQICFLDCSIQQWIQYCQISINQILEIIKIDFVLLFLIKNTQHQILIKMTLENIFQKISFDLKVINRFLQKHLRVIIKQKHQLSFRINQIYQKLLFINSNFNKFTSITKHLNQQFSFQKYQVDKQLNKSIQIDLYQREDQKKSFISSKNKILHKDQQKKTFDQQDNTDRLTVQGDTMLRLNQFI